MSKESDSLQEAHLKFAKSTNNRVWELLEKTGRTPSEDQEMLLAAQASLYHWLNAGTAVHAQRGCWILSRVYITLNRAEPALEWALKCQEITENSLSEMEDFDLAYAQESIARAYAQAGDQEQAEKHYALAAKLGKNIADPEDQQIFMNDLKGGDWYDLFPD